MGLGIAMGIAVSFAISEHVLFLLGLPVFGSLLLTYHLRKKQRLADVRR